MTSLGNKAPAAGGWALRCARWAAKRVHLALGLLAGSLAATGSAQARDWHIGSGQEVSSPAAMNWAQLRPGDVVWIHPGSYTGNALMQDVVGNATKPIRVKPFDAARPPQLLDGITIRRSHWLQVSGLDVTVTGWRVLPSPYKTWAAVIIDQGSSHITLQQNIVHDAYLGVAVQGAGLGLQLLDNQVLDNGYHGLVVMDSSGTATTRGLIRGNLIRGNGQHGLELESSFFTVENNRVQDNGHETRVATPVGGTSGIHLYSDGVGGGCSDNIVRYNHVSGQVDRRAADGNGLHMDHFCDRNLFAFNVSWGNDGSGLGLYAAAGNTIHSNTLRGNMRDTQRPSRLPGVLMGELILTSANWLHGRNTEDATRDNKVYDNVIVATRANLPVVNIDWIVTDDPNQVGPNLLWSITGAPVINRGGLLARDAASADSLTGTSGHVVEAPAFVNTLAPAADGLRLSRKPSGNGVKIKPQVPDMIEALPVSGASYFGAYYTAP